MNAFHVEEINLTGGPLDSDVIPVMPDQMAFYYIANDRTHTYFRIGDTRNFFYVGSRMNGPSRNGLEVAGFSTFQDHSGDGDGSGDDDGDGSGDDDGDEEDEG